MKQENPIAELKIDGETAKTDQIPKENRDAPTLNEISLEATVPNVDVEVGNNKKDQEITFGKQKLATLKDLFASMISIFKIEHKIPRWMKATILTTFIVSYFIYFVSVLLVSSRKEKENYWCQADGFLIIVTTTAVVGILYYKIVKKFYGKIIYSLIIQPTADIVQNFKQKRSIRITTYALPVLLFVVFLLIDTREDRSRLISAFGVVVLIAIASLMSTAPKSINFHQVYWGISLQIFFGLLILRTSVGRSTFECIGDKFTTFLGFTDVGSKFAFGELLTVQSYVFGILTVIIFFGMAVSVLQYYGILQWIILKLGWVLENTMQTTPCESMAAAANIFLGLCEAPLVIMPYVHQLTNSEIHAVMTGGFATVAGGILSAYISFGIKASHLLSASIMSAPAALAISKVFYPETESSVTDIKNIVVYKGNEKHVLHAVMNGLSTSLIIIGNITASLIAFVAMTTFLNSLLDWFCQLLDYEQGTCNVQGVLGYILTPIAWLMGVPTEDCRYVGYLLGTKIMLTEFYAYEDLGKMFRKGLISERSVVIATYALCGFSNLASLGVQMASLGSMAPSRRQDISKLVVRALVAGNFACFLTAAVAGALSQDTTIRAIDFNSTTFTLP